MLILLLFSSLAHAAGGLQNELKEQFALNGVISEQLRNKKMGVALVFDKRSKKQHYLRVGDVLPGVFGDLRLVRINRESIALSDGSEEFFIKKDSFGGEVSGDQPYSREEGPSSYHRGYERIAEEEYWDDAPAPPPPRSPARLAPEPDVPKYRRYRPDSPGEAEGYDPSDVDVLEW